MDWWLISSSSSSLLWLLFTLLLAIAHLLNLRRKPPPKNIPPGPFPLPILGNILDLTEDQPHLAFTKLAKIHGPLMTLKLGQVTAVVVSSAAVAKEVLQKHDLVFASRSVPDSIHALDHHKFSVAWLPANGIWRSLRKVCISHIFNSQKLEANQGLRLDQIRQVIGEIQSSCREGKAIDIGEASFKAMLAALSSTIMSQNLANSTSVYLQDFMKDVRISLEIAGLPNISDYFPVLRWIDPQGRRRGLEKHCGKLLGIFDRVIDERLEARRTPGYVPTNDMLEILVAISEENDSKMNRKLMKHLFLDLFVAGTDTTSVTVEWAMAELLRNPKIMSKAQQELELVLGRGKLLTEADLPKLPFLHAIINETMRLHPAGVFLLPREVGADVEIDGYVVPKGARVLINVYALNRDPSKWENPDTFVPERFLESNIESKGKHFEFLPFGSGRRMCVGMPLAMRTLPLLLGSLINSFNWKLEDGVTPETLDMEDKFGLALHRAKALRAIPVPVE